MRWDELFEDLEGQADSWHRVEREAEVAERTRSEVGQLTLLNRLRSNEGGQVAVRLLGGTALTGTLVRVGADWMLLQCRQEVVVPVSAVATAIDLPLRTLSAGAVSIVASRLTLSSVLRALAMDRARVVVALRDQSTVAGTPDRVGADFVDLAMPNPDEPAQGGAGRRVTVAYGAISAVTRDASGWA
jgi:hypothetical protein